MPNAKCPECNHVFENLDKPIPHPRPMGLTSSIKLCGISGNPTFNSYKMNDFAINTGVGPTRFQVSINSVDKSRKSNEMEFTSYDCCLFTDTIGIGIEWPAAIKLRVEDYGSHLGLTVEVDGKVRLSFETTQDASDVLSADEIGLAISLARIYIERMTRLDDRTSYIAAMLSRLSDTLQRYIHDQCAREVASQTTLSESKVLNLLPYTHEPHVSGTVMAKLLQSWAIEPFQAPTAPRTIRTSKHAIVADYRTVHKGICGCFFPGKVHLPTVRSQSFKVQPLRLYDSISKTVIIANGQRHDIEEYVCISYPWASYGDVQLEEVCEQYTKSTGMRYFWIDRWCINQRDETEKENEIPKMFDYYNTAHSIVVLPGVELPYFDNLKAGLGDFIEVTTNLSNDAKAWKTSPWLQRCWTFQEAAAAEVCKVWTGTPNSHFVDLTTVLSISRAERTNLSIALNGAIATACTETGPSKVPFGVCDTAGIDSYKSYAMSVVRCESHQKTTFKEAYQRPLGELIDMIRGRKATVEQDEYYSLFSMASEENLPPVNYKQSLHELVCHLVESGALSTNILLTNSRQGTNRDSWVPKPCSERQFSNLERGLNTIQPNIIDGSLQIEVAKFFLKGEDGITHAPIRDQHLQCVFGKNPTGSTALSTAELVLDENLPPGGEMYVIKPKEPRSYVIEDAIVIKAIEMSDDELSVIGATIGTFIKVGWNWKGAAVLLALGKDEWCVRKLSVNSP